MGVGGRILGRDHLAVDSKLLDPGGQLALGDAELALLVRDLGQLPAEALQLGRRRVLALEGDPGQVLAAMLDGPPGLVLKGGDALGQPAAGRACVGWRGS